MTAIAALQCVERGLLVLDDDIATILPEWKDRNLLLGFEQSTGAPILEKIDDKISLRMLLTHSSGLGYAFIDEEFAQFVEYKVKQGWKVESQLLVRSAFSIKVLLRSHSLFIVPRRARSFTFQAWDFLEVWHWHRLGWKDG